MATQNKGASKNSKSNQRNDLSVGEFTELVRSNASGCRVVKGTCSGSLPRSNVGCGQEQEPNPGSEGKKQDLIEQAEYIQHAYGQVWQQIDADVFSELVANIEQRGLDNDIILYQGMVLDGWHRYLACLATKTPPKFSHFDGSDLDAAELVHASGIRRQSSADQRYASFELLCQACPAFMTKYEQLRRKGQEQQLTGKPLATSTQRVDVVQAKADAVGVSKATAKKVERIKKEKPEAIAEIAAGRTTANKEVRKLKEVTKAVRTNRPKQRATDKNPGSNAHVVDGDDEYQSIHIELRKDQFAELRVHLNQLAGDGGDTFVVTLRLTRAQRQALRNELEKSLDLYQPGTLA